VRVRNRVLIGLVLFGSLTLSGCGLFAPAAPAVPPPAAAPAPAPPAAAAPSQPFQGQGQSFGTPFQSQSDVEASLGRRSPEGGYWPPSIQLGQSQLGNILYDGYGFPLYMSTNDSTQPMASHCTGDCTKQFFPVLVNAQITYQNVDPSHIGTILRGDGTQQLSYYGHPVYRNINDLVPGQAVAHGLNNSWYAIAYDGSIAGSH
jgi:predicted lipoprotein with Yx(FWY)xxD motif